MSNTQLTFSDKVRAVVCSIPKGSVLTYQEVAERAGNKKSARAVARVMATNYDPKVPCHRVIRADGTLGGYNRGGTQKKLQILLDEGAKL